MDGYETWVSDLSYSLEVSIYDTPMLASHLSNIGMSYTVEKLRSPTFHWAGGHNSAYSSGALVWGLLDVTDGEDDMLSEEAAAGLKMFWLGKEKVERRKENAQLKRSLLSRLLISPSSLNRTEAVRIVSIQPNLTVDKMIFYNICVNDGILTILGRYRLWKFRTLENDIIFQHVQPPKDQIW